MSLPDTAEGWVNLARGLREEQRMGEAVDAIDRARLMAPAERLIAFLQAQLHYEVGLPAAHLFAGVTRLWPENADALRNWALALASEGQPEAAEAVLAEALMARPDWLEGHRVLASLRWTAGQREGFDASFREATAALPGHQGLWLGWFTAIAQQRDWARAGLILDAAARQIGETRALAVARVFHGVESDDRESARRWLRMTGEVADPFLDLSRIRFALREGDAAQALALALPLTHGPIAGQVWPYVHACWRLLGDSRAAWLAGDPVFAAAVDPGLSRGEIAELAQLLRSLHTAKAHYAEQSVRAGTQTDRSVLLRREPILQRARAALLEGIARFVETLPPADADHPVLGTKRGRTKVSGSWSVRLGAGGYNVVHSHPMGWLSSAFYVSLPAPGEMGVAPAGHFQLGGPPPELGLDLAPLREFAPEVGRMVVFPSFMWHGTVPISGDERLNIAFDVVPGQAGPAG